jgi:CDP-paratose 2-epimerase
MSRLKGRVALITGGAGFIGSNLADRLLSEGRRVLIFDNLSRHGAERNVRWLLERHAGRVEVETSDVRDAPAVHAAVSRASEIYHLAAQVAVTTSLSDPLSDFSVNARGTLNVLEAARSQDEPPSILYTSTNKVYGDLADVRLRMEQSRYLPADPELAARGIDESRPLDFGSPYGCSKGAADQYVRDYARSFGLPTVVLRMSCIYGPRQLGNEDQGWVAHFLLRMLKRQPLTIFGDGRQVRDVLYVDDLIDVLVLTMKSMGRIAGQVFNLGGGPGNTLSLLELTSRFGESQGLQPLVRHAPWRRGDQRYYVASCAKLTAATGWFPRISIEEGLDRLHSWLNSTVPAAERALPVRTQRVSSDRARGSGEPA